MRKIIAISLGLVVVVGIFLLLDSRNESAETPDISNTDVYSVAVLSSDVFLKTQQDDGFASITGSVDIRAGAEIKTSAKGRAKILYPNGTITTIEGDSHIIISDLAHGGGASRLELVFGSMWSKIQNILGTNEYYEVETGNIVASVRGTIFALEYRNLTSTVFGIGNKVQVSVKDASGSPIPSTQTDVESGEKVIVSGTAPVGTTSLPTTPITDSEINSGFVERNLIEITDEEAENSWHKGVKNLLKRLKKAGSPVPTATATQTPSPTPTVASLNPAITSVSPRTIKVGENFDILGKNFLSLTGAAQVQSVFLGSSQVTFVTQSTTMLMVRPGSLKAGVYDVHITSTQGIKSTLLQALTIR